MSPDFFKKVGELMRFLDIHSHILPQIDDGAKDVENSEKLLQMMKKQGVSDVIATPHFYPMRDNVDEFLSRVGKATAQLEKVLCDEDLPNIYIGCEIHYFNGIGKSRELYRLTIAGTNYILLELPYGIPIDDGILKDIRLISEDLGLIPILAHIERYSLQKGFRKLLKLVAGGTALAHINAAALISNAQGRICEKLLKKGYISFIASDAHSPDKRPPLTGEAMEYIYRKMGRRYSAALIKNHESLLMEIEGKNE